MKFFLFICHRSNVLLSFAHLKRKAFKNTFCLFCGKVNSLIIKIRAFEALKSTASSVENLCDPWEIKFAHSWHEN